MSGGPSHHEEKLREARARLAAARAEAGEAHREFLFGDTPFDDALRRLHQALRHEAEAQLNLALAMREPPSTRRDDAEQRAA